MGRRHGILVLLAVLALTMSMTAAQAAYLGNITFDKTKTSFLDNETHVNITIDYKVDEPGGCYIYARPYTNGFLTPNYAASPSPLHLAGTGVATQYFRIAAGDHIVDQVCIYMKSADTNTVLLELFVPVNFVYGEYGVFNVQTSHNARDRIIRGEDLEISFDYGTDWPGQVRIYARPFTDGSLTPGYGAGGSIALPPDGSYSQHFTFGGDADVTDIRFQIWDESNSQLLATFFYPFEIYWREWGVTQIEFNWAQDMSLHNDQNLVSSFTFTHADPGSLYVWAWCITDGGYTPGAVYQGSPPHWAGPNPVTRYTRVDSGEQYVDAVCFIVGLPGDTYQMFHVPVDYHWAPHAVQSPVFVPASPAILSYGERVEIDFDYLTDDMGGCRVFGRAAHNGTLLYGMSSSGSPLYPHPGGIGDYWLSYGAETLANQIRLWATNDDQSVLHLEHFYEGWWVWGPSHVITEAPELPPVPDLLGHNYPNPFNPSTTIPVNLSEEMPVRLNVYDLQGRIVRRLHDGPLPAGPQAFEFDGRGLPSGVYFYRLETPEVVRARRMVLVK